MESETPIPWDDPTLLSRFGRLEVVAKLIVEGYLTGQHKSPFKGASIEFVEHRQYAPGDEIRHIDWRAYGKTGRYYIKEFEDETNLRAVLILDASGSMEYAGRTISKFHYARQLAATLTYLLLKQRDAVGLVTFDSVPRERIEPSTHVATFQRVCTLLDQTSPQGDTSLAGVLKQVAPTIHRRSLVVLMTDGFDDIDRLVEALKLLRFGRHEVLLFHILAPEEEEFPFSDPTEFLSLEQSSLKVQVDPKRLREQYLAQFKSFCETLQHECGSLGIDYQKINTEIPFHEALSAFLDSRMRR